MFTFNTLYSWQNNNKRRQMYVNYKVIWLFVPKFMLRWPSKFKARKCKYIALSIIGHLIFSHRQHWSGDCCSAWLKLKLNTKFPLITVSGDWILMHVNYKIIWLFVPPFMLRWPSKFKARKSITQDSQYTF